MTKPRRGIDASALRLTRRLSERAWWHGVTVDYAGEQIVVHAKAGSPSAADLAVFQGGRWEGIPVVVKPPRPPGPRLSAN